MNWQDEGYLLSKIKFRENANIINVLTMREARLAELFMGVTQER